MKKFLSGLQEKFPGLYSRRKTVLTVAICTAVLLILALCVKPKEGPGEIERGETPPAVTETDKPEDPIDPSGFRLSEFDDALIT